MPLEEDQSSDSDSLRLSESIASSSDSECSRQSFNSDSSSKPSSPVSSPPKVITFDEMMAATRNLTNLTLAHEIAVNADFCMKHVDFPQNSLVGTVKTIVHKAFWDCLESQLNKDPPEYEHAIKLFEEIKETLLSFLAPGANRIQNQICEVLDTDLIRQQAEHNAVDIHGLANYIINTMGKLCAPIRDDDIKQLKATDNIIELLRKIFHVLDLMKMDMVNYLFENIRPYLQRNLVDYERIKFQEILEETPNALDRTTEWIKESIEDELSSSDESSSSSGATSSSKPNLSPTLVLNNGYLKLLEWDYHKVIPETLITDEVRLQELREKLNQLKIIACVCLITNNTVGTAIVNVPDFADQLKKISFPLLEGMSKKTFDLKEALNAISVQICSKVNKSLSERGFPTLDKEMQNNLLGQIGSVVEKNNPVSSLIDKRIQLFMRSLLALPSTRKCMPAVPGGLSVIQPEMELLGAQYANIVNFNKQVYGPFYASILRKLLFSDAPKGNAETEAAAN